MGDILINPLPPFHPAQLFPDEWLAKKQENQVEEDKLTKLTKKRKLTHEDLLLNPQKKLKSANTAVANADLNSKAKEALASINARQSEDISETPSDLNNAKRIRQLLEDLCDTQESKALLGRLDKLESESAQAELKHHGLLQELNSARALSENLTDSQRETFVSRLDGDRKTLVSSLSALAPQQEAALRKSEGVDLDAIYDFMNNFKKDYQGLFQFVAERMGKFVRGFNDVVGSLSQYISEGKDGKILLDGDKLWDRIGELRKQFYSSSDICLYPTDGSYATKKECEAIAKQLGLPLSHVRDRGDGNFRVEVNGDSFITPLWDTLLEFGFNNAGTPPVEIDAAKWNSIYNAFDTQKQNLNTIMNGFTDKYSNSQTVFNAAIEILKNFLDQFLDGLRQACRA